MNNTLILRLFSPKNSRVLFIGRLPEPDCQRISGFPYTRRTARRRVLAVDFLGYGYIFSYDEVNGIPGDGKNWTICVLYYMLEVGPPWWNQSPVSDFGPEGTGAFLCR